MSPDIDELVRSTMRRHADDAPTRIDLDAVRTRSHQITVRRRLEAVTAVLTTLVVLLAAGFAASRLRTEATPIEPSPTGSAWTAFFRFDQNGGTSGQSDLLVRTASGETQVATADRAAKVVGWYGADHRTLVYTEGNYTASIQSALKSVTFADDGRVTAGPAPLSVPGAQNLTGVAFGLADGLAVWRTTGTDPQAGELVRVDDALERAVTQPLPKGFPAAVTPAVVVVTDGSTNRTSIVGTDGKVQHTVTLCETVARAVAPDDVHVANGCADGHVDLLNLSTGKVFTTSAIPGGTDPGAILGLWYDPALGLHLSMTPAAQANFTDVRDFTWDGITWNADGTGVLTRVFPVGSSPIRLEHLVKDGVDSFNVGRWIVERPHDVDLGPATGTIAVRPVETPTPSPSPTTDQALPPAPTTRPWTAELQTVVGAGIPRVAVQVTRPGQQVTPVTTIDEAQVAIAGWTGPGRRTLVWGATQDYPGDQALESATLDAAGKVVAGPARLKAPDDGADLTGRAVVLSDGRLVVWRYSLVDGRPKGTLYRFSADLKTATTQQLAVGDLVFVTADHVGIQDAQQAPSTLTIVAADGTTASVEPSIGSCATGYGASTSFTGDFVALSCGSNGVDIVPVAMAGSAGVQPLATLPDGTKIVATWFTDRDDTYASTRADDGVVSTWVYQTDATGANGTWVQAPTQGVAIARYVDGYAVQLLAQPTRTAEITGAWQTATDPTLDYGIGTGLDSLIQRPSS